MREWVPAGARETGAGWRMGTHVLGPGARPRMRGEGGDPMRLYDQPSPRSRDSTGDTQARNVQACTYKERLLLVTG
jgi:hypothetical protein